MRYAALTVLLAACAEEPSGMLVEDEVPPPAEMVLVAPDRLFLGEVNTFSVVGNLGEQEMVHLVMSRTGLGSSCPRVLGGNCLSVLAPRLLGSGAINHGVATIDVVLPPATALGSDMHFQAAVVRGRGGMYSVVSDVDTRTVEAYVLGCTHPSADNYDAAATVDNGTCAIPGCTDPGNAEYDPDATYDDGTCAPPPFAVWDPVRSAPGVSYANGDRDASAPSNNVNVWATIGKDSGKWYWEVTWLSGVAPHLMVGAGSATAPNNNWNLGGQGAMFYSFANNPYTTLPYSGTNRGYGALSVIGFALDMDNRTLTHFVNGVQGATVTNLPATQIFPMIAYAHGNPVRINAGQDAFVYTPPAGFTPGLYE